MPRFIVVRWNHRNFVVDTAKQYTSYDVLDRAGNVINTVDGEVFTEGDYTTVRRIADALNAQEDVVRKAQNV